MTDDSSSGPVLVLGATGGQGGAVAAALLASGRPVRALVRDPSSPAARSLADRGAELAAAGFTDVPALTSAMRGAAAAFTLTSPFESGAAAEVGQGSAIIAAAREAELPYLVFSSIAAALSGSGVPHFESKAAVERLLAASGIPHTVVAPTYFYDNALTGRAAIEDGVLSLPLAPDRPLQQLARDDLGRFVALVLASPADAVGRRFELAASAPTGTEMAAALTTALGRPVTFSQVPLAAVRRQSPDMAAMWSFLGGPGYQADMTTARQRYPSAGWMSLADWASRAFGVSPALEAMAHCLSQLRFRQCAHHSPLGDPPFVVDRAAKPPFVDEVDRAEEQLQRTRGEPVPVRALKDDIGHEPSIPPIRAVGDQHRFYRTDPASHAPVQFLSMA